MISTSTAPVASKQRSVLEIMDLHGHTEVQWDPDDPTEVESAEETFTKLLGEGYAAYRMAEDGSTGEQIREFDPFAGRILLSPAMVGG